MKDKNFHAPWGRLVLAATLAAGALLSQAQAQETASGPKAILSFSGTEGEAPGKQAWSAPVYNAGDGRLYGFTRAGGESYEYIAGWGAIAVASGRGFSVGTDGSGYVSWSLGGGGGSPLTNVVVDSQGRAVTAGQNTLRDDTGAATKAGFRLVGVGEDGLVWFDRPSEAIADAAPSVSPRGTLAADDKGNVYFGMGSSQNCNATNPDRSLYRRTPEGAIEAVVDFCDFTEARAGSALSFLKGGAPFINLYSTRDEALYILSTLSAQNGVDQYPDIVSGTDKVVGFLVRIGNEALERGSVTADDIQVLRAFRQSEANGGIGAATDVRRSAMVEDGDWLYGTGTNILWRLNKTDPENSFAIVHSFLSEPGHAAPVQEDAGVAPMGDLVRARDGNLYGVTETDATALNASGRAAGAGSLYRVVVRSAPDRSDDSIEFLHYFDAATQGSAPAGLSAGPAVNGVQTLFGAVSSGLEGNGGLFSYEIAVPQVAITQFAASADSVVAGGTVRLDWASENAVACTASGDNGGVWAGAQQTSAAGVPVTLTQEGDNTFILECQDDAGESASASVTVTVTAPTPEPSPGGDGDNDDGGGSGGPVGPVALLMLAGLALSRRVVRGVLI